MAESLRAVIVGGGVHGVHLAVRLLDADLVELDGLRIVEPDGLLARFREQCTRCGMTELRSPFVHHVGTDPFSLRDYARETDRTDEFAPSEFGADRPSVSLFFDHAESVCEEYDLESAVVESRVTGLTDREAAVEVKTTDGELTADWCLLAVGHGGSYTMPDVVDTLPPTAAVSHVWNGFDPECVGEQTHVGIVGGSITATQLTTALAQPGREITLFSRSPLRVEQLEAGTDWMHFSGLDRLHELPPASRERECLVQEARYDGTVPPYTAQRFRRTVEEQSVTIAQTEICEITPAGGPLVVTCQDGTTACLDELVCATGFDSPYDGALFRRLRSETTLQTGYRGAPVLDDDTLRWRREDGSLSRVFVSGAAAQQVLGPFSRNIIGARRAGSAITDEIGCHTPTETVIG